VERVESAADLRTLIAEWREAGDTIALVPTMGNLHKGHLSLVQLAAEQVEHVIVSVFVNPTQFGPDEDYAEYPRTLDMDARRLSRAGVDVLFCPSVESIYPNGTDDSTTVLVPGLSDELCGEHRPGHFQGVTSVVCRLLNICSPNLAVFGQKDYQQFVILQRMVVDLHLPVRLIAGPTERESSGLAMSSRNSNLDKDQAEAATIIYKSLQNLKAKLEAGEREFAVLEQAAMAEITAAGLVPEYVAIRRVADLTVADAHSLKLMLLAAASLGQVRLIDNLPVSLMP
jgi:pantoate--beta-alanine ligase